MTAIRGLREAVVLAAVAATLSAVAALVWVLVGSGGFVDRFAMCLIIAGIVLAVTGNVAFSRASTTDALAFRGNGPEREEANSGGGRVLTSIGIFLFVSVPLIIIGVVLLT
jgi:hypothetical protein